MSLHSRVTVMPTSGNQALPSSGDFRNPKTRKPNLRAGQLAFVDTKTNKFLAPGDLASSKNVALYVGTGKKGSRAKEVKRAGGGRKGINFCQSSITGNAQAPTCGTQEYVDIFFDCLDNYDAISLNVKIRDWYSKGFRQMNEDDEHPFTVPTSLLRSKCDGDCDPQTLCHESACWLVDAINDKGEKQRDPSVTTFGYRSGVYGQGKQLPATAGILHNSAFAVQEFCVGLVSDECKDCVAVQEITAISGGGILESAVSIEGVGLDGRVSFEDMTDVMAQLNEALNPVGGYAHLQKGIGNCCQYKVVITSCATEDFQLAVTKNGVTSQEDPCAKSNPFTTITHEPVCKGCDAEGTTQTFTCGIRIYTDPVDVDCFCDGAVDPDNAKSYLSRHIDAEFLSPYTPGVYHISRSAPATPPKGLGYQLSQALVHESFGGIGRDHRSSNVFTGYLGRLDEDSPYKKAMGIDCKASYCAINLIVHQRAMPDLPVKSAYYPSEQVLIAIPDADEVTKASFEGYLAELDKLGLCPGGVALSCSVSGVEITANSITIEGPDTVENGATVDYDAVSTEADGELKGTWSTSDEALATIDPNTGTLTMIDGSAPVTIAFRYLNPSGDVTVTKAVANA